MWVHELPSWSKYHANALSWVVDKVSKYDSKTLQSIPFNVKEFVSVGLDDLQEDGHPLVESVIQARINQVVVNAISPTNSPQTKVKNVQNLISPVISNLFVCKAA